MGAILERKIKLVKEISDDKTNEEILSSLEKYYYRLLSDAPCAYSSEELESRLNEAEQDFELNKGIPHDSIKKLKQP